ncbi:MAG: 4-hydroxybutyrate CoA-transferase, partial [Candidatus Poribacteria bacterium]
MHDLNWQRKAVEASDAVRRIKSGAKIFVHGAAATPTPLLDALCARRDIENIFLYHLHMSGSCSFADPKYAGRITSVSLFVGPALRKPIEEGRADFVPVFLTDIPDLFSSGMIPLDAAFVQLSPPDKH